MITCRKLGTDTFFWTWVNVDEKQSDAYINTVGFTTIGGEGQKDLWEHLGLLGSF
jgi:hypothetical protein